MADTLGTSARGTDLALIGDVLVRRDGPHGRSDEPEQPRCDRSCRSGFEERGDASDTAQHGRDQVELLTVHEARVTQRPSGDRLTPTMPSDAGDVVSSVAIVPPNAEVVHGGHPEIDESRDR